MIIIQVSHNLKSQVGKKSILLPLIFCKASPSTGTDHLSQSQQGKCQSHPSLRLLTVVDAVPPPAAPAFSSCRVGGVSPRQ